MKFRLLILGILISFGALVSSCRSSSPSVQYYQLHLGATEAPSTVKGVILALDTFVIDSAYDDQRMVYRTSLHRLDYYHYHRWSAPPGVLITDFLREAFVHQNAFEAVVSGYSTQSHLIQTGRVAALEEVNLEDGRWVARVILNLQLRNTRTGAIVWVRQLREEEVMGAQTPEGLAEAVSMALLRVVETTTPEIIAVGRSLRVKPQEDQTFP
ncbi:MAG: ABC-type transport auxiliary lipoprotein family protein [Bradymonadaceae bacterium]